MEQNNYDRKNNNLRFKIDIEDGDKSFFSIALTVNDIKPKDSIIRVDEDFSVITVERLNVVGIGKIVREIREVFPELNFDTVPEGIIVTKRY